MFCSPFYPRKTSLRHELPPETHTKRQATQHDCLPSSLAMGTKELKYCRVWKTIFCTGANQSSQGRTKNSCKGLTSPTNPPAKDPFHFYSLNPLLPQFEQSAGSIPLQTLWIPLKLLKNHHSCQLCCLLLNYILQAEIFFVCHCVSACLQCITHPLFFCSCQF